MEHGNRSFFIANACHVCKAKNASCPCAVCNMIFYCSPEHRRENWLDHSEICWAINKITEGGRCQILWELFDGNDFTKFRHAVANKCTELMKRSLKPWEFEMIYYPRMCNVCREFNWANLTRCKNCEFIYTCGKNHFRQDHANWCKTFKIYSDLIVSQSRGAHLKPLHLEIKSNSYESMMDILKENTNRNKNIELQIVLTTELLTYPLTVFHGLKTIKAFQSRELEILFIGAEIQAEVEPLDKWEKYLLHCLDNIEYLNLKFLGPELRESRQEFSGNLCETCRERRKNLKFQFISGKFYHEYKTNGTERLDLICAFNSGMYRDYGFANENSWEATIEKLFTSGSPPVLITEYTCRELKMVLERIRRLMGNVVAIAESQVNPFASFKPGLNIISEDESPVIFKNYFYSVLKRFGITLKPWLIIVNSGFLGNHNPGNGSN